MESINILYKKCIGKIVANNNSKGYRKCLNVIHVSCVVVATLLSYCQNWILKQLWKMHQLV